jgi:hypothetical protein
MTEDEKAGDFGGEEATIVEVPVPTVTVTLTQFEVRVLQVILERLIAGQAIDPSTIDYGSLVHLEKQLKPGPPSRTV